TAVLVGHNPGCESLVDHLARTSDPAAAEAIRFKYPTCGVAVLDVHVPWAELTAGSAHLAAFVAPRG
ncbi:MAG TPA: histidine phosphatase family protein, partial [Phycicoccus sp.]|nr:histidine phosphatase family protein [Phycicoccus sp.]